MTPERAQELLDLMRGPDMTIPWAPGEAPTIARGGYISSSKPELYEDPRGMSREEKKEIKRYWRRLSGDSCFITALVVLAQE
jgi:hypothetical protein